MFIINYPQHISILMRWRKGLFPEHLHPGTSAYIFHIPLSTQKSLRDSLHNPFHSVYSLQATPREFPYLTRNNDKKKYSHRGKIFEWYESIKEISYTIWLDINNELKRTSQISLHVVLLFLFKVLAKQVGISMRISMRDSWILHSEFFYLIKKKNI